MRRYLISLIFSFSFLFCNGQIKQIDIDFPSAILCPDSTVSIVRDKDLCFFYQGDLGKLKGLDSVISISTGYHSTLFLRADSTVWVNGNNEHGQQALGNFDLISFHALHKVQGLRKIVKIVAGMHTMAALDVDGHLWIWGLFNNFLGECVDWHSDPSLCIPHKMNIENVIDVSVNWGNVLMLCKDGKVWQKNTYYNNTSIFDLEEVPNLKDVKKISGGTGRRYALNKSGVLYSWINANDIPWVVDSNVSKIEASWGHCVYLKNDGSVLFIREDYYSPNDDVKIKIEGLKNVKDIYCSPQISGAVSFDDKIWTWGNWCNVVMMCDTVTDFKQRYWSCIDCKEPIEAIALDTTINTDTNVSLKASTSNGGMYNWQPNTGVPDPSLQTIVVNIAKSNSFTANLFDTLGCNYRNEIFNLHVRDCDTIINKYSKIFLDTVVIPETQGVLKASGNPPYKWSPSTGLSNTVDKETKVQFKNEIQYSVSQKGDYNCTYSQDYAVKIRKCDTIITHQYYNKLDTTIDQGSQIVLRPSHSYSTYSWLPNPRLSCTDCPNPEYQNNGDEILYVNLFNNWNCPYTETFSVKTLKSNQELTIPDIFTPNSDGFNDFFIVVNLKTNTTLKVFNRQGQLVYSSSNYQNNWDGKDNSGHILNQDNYFYVLKVQGEAGEYKGSVFIKR